MPDINLTCRDCGKPFDFTERDQEFYAEKGWQNQPTRCRDCAKARKADVNGGARGADRQMYPAVCSDCGKSTTVPFEPKEDRPVRCMDCFKASKG